MGIMDRWFGNDDAESKTDGVKYHRIQGFAQFKLNVGSEGNPVERAKARQKAIQDYDLCMDMMVCPNCGSDLEKVECSQDSGNEGTDYSIKYCKKCQMRDDEEASHWG